MIKILLKQEKNIQKFDSCFIIDCQLEIFMVKVDIINLMTIRGDNLKFEKEITVKVISDYDTLNQKLLENGFIIKEEYIVNDIYMINKNINLSKLDSLEILKKCILVRDIVGIKKALVYKYKEYDKNGNILKQGKVNCRIKDINEAIDFMKAINYKELIKINDKCIVYVNDRTELVIQLVNNNHIFIEMEDHPEYIDKKYISLEEMKDELDSYNLPYDKNNYFVKKAEIILNETL